MRSGCSSVVFLLLDILSARRDVSAWVQGHFALTASQFDISDLLTRAMHIPWLGPGLVLATFLLLTLRRTRRVARHPICRTVRAPNLERYEGVIPKRHQDLEL